MELNYVALQELYDTLVSAGVSMSHYADSPVYKAFKECDEKLSESIAFDYLKKLQDRCENLERSNKVLRDDNDKLGDKILELKKERDAKDKENSTLISVNAYLSDRLASQYQKLTIENKSLQKELDLAKRNKDGWRSRAMQAEKRIEELEKSRKCYRQIHVGEGARHLWDMLQNVNDSQTFEIATYFPDVTGMEDIISWDLDDFLDAYKKWQEEKKQKETDRMRKWLADFCDGKFCEGCPLESEEYKCGCGYSFKKANESDTRIIPDEDIKRYYEKARGTVCDIKPKEEKEHQLEYGDAVRVPWRDYDYMYIGPEGNHIRLFNPKTHSVVVVPSTENLPYQGCKIILYNEDDIRKIWKDKK